MTDRLKKVTRRVALKTAVGVVGVAGVMGSAFSWLLMACSGDDSSGYGYGYGEYGYGLSLRGRIGSRFVRRA